MAYYKELRQHLEVLDEAGLLIRIKREINKDTELNPLVRLQYRGLPEEERNAFLFENIIDSKGRKYAGSVANSVSAGSTRIYAMGMMCEPQDIADKWSQGRSNPVEPVVVDTGPVHDEIHIGASLLEHNGLIEFPVTNAVPGFDSGPYFTAPCWVTRDPETGAVNVGTYRGQVKSTTRAGLMFGAAQHIAHHWRKCREQGKPLEAAVVIGAVPVIGYVSIAKLDYGENEFACAGGAIGGPIELVRCKSVNLEVPATAEVVIEGEISTTELEPEGPFGEMVGYMGPRGNRYIFEVRCITHRKKPIWHDFCSQFPPSESSKMRQVALEASHYNRLRHRLGMSEVKAVAVHEDGACTAMVVISMSQTEQQRVWQALEAVAGSTKFVIAVDDDVDPWDAGAVNWAMSFTVQPHRDCRIRSYSLREHPPQIIVDPSQISPERGADKQPKDEPQVSQMLINATRKWPYPPHSLPKKEYMEGALRIWEEEKLPALKLRKPWWGDNLGHWTPREEELATLAVNSEYAQLGETIAKERIQIDRE